MNFQERQVPYMVAFLNERPMSEGTFIHRWYAKFWSLKISNSTRSLLPSPYGPPSDQLRLVIDILGDIGSDASASLPYFIEELKNPYRSKFLLSRNTLETLVEITPGSGYEEDVITALKKTKKHPRIRSWMMEKIDNSIHLIQTAEEMNR